MDAVGSALHLQKHRVKQTSVVFGGDVEAHMDSLGTWKSLILLHATLEVWPFQLLSASIRTNLPHRRFPSLSIRRPPCLPPLAKWRQPYLLQAVATRVSTPFERCVFNYIAQCQNLNSCMRMCIPSLLDRVLVRCVSCVFLFYSFAIVEAGNSPPLCCDAHTQWIKGDENYNRMNNYGMKIEPKRIL